MKNYIEEMEELCESAVKAIAEANKKLETAGGKITSADAQYLNDLTHMVKSIKTTIAMEEEYGNDYSERGGSYARGGRIGGRGGRSNRGGNYMDDGSYEGSYDGGYEDGSYARGRGRNARRDNMGRYSREGGYSRAGDKEDFMENLRELMEEAPDEQSRQHIQNMMRQMGQ